MFKRKHKPISVASRMAWKLMLLFAFTLTIVQLLKIIPDPKRAELRRKAVINETLAITSSLLAQFRDEAIIEKNLTAIVARLIWSCAMRAGPPNEAIGQERTLLDIEQLFNLFLLDQTFVTDRLPDFTAQFSVGVAVRAPVMVVTDVETGKVPLMFFARFRDDVFFRASLFARPDHDCGAVRIIGPHKDGAMPAKLLKSHPDVRLDVLHQMSDVDRTVGIGQCGCDENLPLCHEAAFFAEQAPQGAH